MNNESSSLLKGILVIGLRKKMKFTLKNYRDVGSSNDPKRIHIDAIHAEKIAA